MKRVFFLLSLICFSAYGSTTKPNSIKNIDAVIVKDDVSIGVHAPKGWSLHQEAAQAMGVCSIYTQSKFDFGNAPAVIYAHISERGTFGDSGVEKLASASEKMYRSQSKDFKVVNQKDYKSKMKLDFKIRDFLEGPSPNNYERVAYLSYKNHILIAVYSSKSKKEFDGNLASFNDFLDTIQPYSSDMRGLSGSCLYPK